LAARPPVGGADGDRRCVTVVQVSVRLRRRFSYGHCGGVFHCVIVERAESAPGVVFSHWGRARREGSFLTGRRARREPARRGGVHVA
jgi:hypothetical protein